MNMIIGKVIHYFDKIRVAAIKLEKPLKIGDKVRFEGVTTSFEQEISSMQNNKEALEKAGKGDEVGVKVNERVRVGDIVWLVV